MPEYLSGFAKPYSKFSLTILLLIVFLFAKGQDKPVTGSWKGFEKSDFSISGYKAYYVKPAHALPGNPWVWRASFPDWHTDMDSILLSKGFYIAYISVDDQYGSPDLYRFGINFIII
jgi:sialidase-1